MKFLLSIAAFAATWTACAQGTFEAILSYSNSPPVSLNSSGTAGWTFQPNTPIIVTNLGCFAYVFDNAAVTNIQVGLWDHNGSLLASDSVTPGSTLFDQSRYESITPVFLAPGQIYHVGVFYPGGTLGLDVASPSLGGGVSPSPDIQFGGAAYSTTGFTFPAEQPGYGGVFYAGPNFRYQEGGVPEPSSWLLLGLGGLLLAARRRNQRL